MPYFAHSVPGASTERWEPLELHLYRVATRASEFASAFGAGEWGNAAGLWHDLGKYRPEFQRRLMGSREQIEHAGLGAALAQKKNCIPLAFVIAGHHSGIPNANAQLDTALRPLVDRLENNRELLNALIATIPPNIVDHSIPDVPRELAMQDARRRLELWIRFLFSTLVDADRLETQAFYEPGARTFSIARCDIATLKRRLDFRMAQFASDTPVKRARADVLAACRKAATAQPGVFTLTAPTGSGKTLSAMAFALAHAEAHNLRRVIVVVPYTTIIEQNAEVYASALGIENVIEHHSNLDEDQRLETEAEQELMRRLAVENWDAPIVITTNVQFFESLLSNHPGRCRKIHNIAESVILIDEAQNLSIDYLDCTLDILHELHASFGCSIVMSTATQPALTNRASLRYGFECVQEIISDTATLKRALSRVRITWPNDEKAASYQDVALAMEPLSQVLAIVHSRADARNLARQLSAPGRFHLSALMCAAHRAEVLRRVRSRLQEGEPVRLVATQLVEAGVDIDFPVVFRALAGLDSIAQAAGRCNREGTLEYGDLIVFRAETKPPDGTLKKGLESTETLLRRYGASLDPWDPGILDEYFRILYMASDTDRHNIQADRQKLNFATVASNVRLVDDNYVRPVVVPWGESPSVVSTFIEAPSRQLRRRLQRFTVNIPDRTLNHLVSIGAVESVDDSVNVLTESYSHLYDATWGLLTDAETPPSPASLII